MASLSVQLWLCTNSIKKIWDIVHIEYQHISNTFLCDIQQISGQNLIFMWTEFRIWMKVGASSQGSDIYWSRVCYYISQMMESVMSQTVNLYYHFMQ
jgi:hypothetical protein